MLYEHLLKEEPYIFHVTFDNEDLVQPRWITRLITNSGCTGQFFGIFMHMLTSISNCKLTGNIQIQHGKSCMEFKLLSSDPVHWQHVNLGNNEFHKYTRKAASKNSCTVNNFGSISYRNRMFDFCF